MTIDEKYKHLQNYILEHGSAAVAFSGGVDSSFLCYAAFEALAEKAIAITVVSPMLPKTEIDDAKKIASQIGIKHFLITENKIDDLVASNPKDRCYYCKKIEFAQILAVAKKNNVSTVFDGSNTDDLNDYRPGLKALHELQIVSPLREAELTKSDIRELSRRFNLPTWDKPSFACLASRIPYGDKIDAEKLLRVEKAEDVLRHAGFKQFRVRSHGDIARIEVSPPERQLFFNDKILDDISRDIKAAGFLFVSMELEGYVMGALNRTHLAGGALPSKTRNDIPVGAL
ncbi:MAG: ATP-dependent sacrificial sulfur transferase LarE [Termitinemataceae bacterium]|nr:MAG: ATP-dependent sacrificial sulfur transferase LarE [Termitinemataceae bacterium]